MSLLGKVGNFLKKTVKLAAPIAAAGVFGPIGAAIGTVVAARGAVGSAQPAMQFPQVQALSPLPGIATAGMSILPRVLPGAGRAIAKYGPEIAAGVAGSYVYDQMGNIVGRKRKYKRINPLNAKAARRAIRRIKAVRKITHDIEKQLPHRTVRSSAPCPPRRRR